jgi:hypothetical protein
MDQSTWRTTAPNTCQNKKQQQQQQQKVCVSRGYEALQYGPVHMPHHGTKHLQQ